LEAGPWVFGWGGDQAAGYRVAMQVAEFFAVLGGGEDVEVVITGEPEGCLGTLLGDGAFEGAEDGGERVGWGFG